MDRLGSTRVRVDPETVEIEEVAKGSRPFRALYEHWERHQWSPFATDFSTDAATFAALDERTRAGLVLVFAHRFHAEFNVAALLAPFLLAAPDYDLQLLLATQVADEHRHIESVLRVYSDVFGVEGGMAAVKALVDAQLDRVGSFPGLREAQRHAVRDEVRHIGIGVSYARRRLTRDGPRAQALIEEIVEGFQAFGDGLLEDASPSVLAD